MANLVEQVLMLKLVIGMNINKGFTLIELLVVLVIIGITLGFAILAFGDFGGSKKIIYAGEQVEHFLSLAQQQAILENSTLGLKIDNSSYQIVTFKQNKWSTASSNYLLYKVHFLPQGTIVSLKSSITSSKNPKIIINPTGETNAFTLTFGTVKQQNIAKISGKGNGELVFSTATNND